MVVIRSRIRCRLGRRRRTDTDVVGRGPGGMENRTIDKPRWNGGSHLKLVNFFFFFFYAIYILYFIIYNTIHVWRRFSPRARVPRPPYHRRLDVSATRFNLHSVYTTAASDMPLVRSRPTTTVAAAETT